MEFVSKIRFRTAAVLPLLLDLGDLRVAEAVSDLGKYCFC